MPFAGTAAALSTTIPAQHFARMWPREVFDYFTEKSERRRILGILYKPGVYILYRDDIPYYVGQADKAMAIDCGSMQIFRAAGITISGISFQFLLLMIQISALKWKRC